MEKRLGNELEHQVSLLEIKPQSIDCGSLSPGQDAKTLLHVSGGPGKVLLKSDQFKVSPTTFEKGENTIEITLLGGHSGELMWDEITLVTDAQTLTVPVTARWTGITIQTSISENLEPIKLQHVEEPQRSSERRTFNGKSCSLCGSNFGYNTGNGTWERCKCNWLQKGVNISKHIIIDLRLGAKEIPSYFEETWRMILGKEKL